MNELIEEARGAVTGDDAPELAAIREENRLRRFRRRLFRSILIVCAVIGVGYAFSPWLKIGFNMNESMEGTVFLILKKIEPEVGQMAAFWPPKNAFYPHTWFVKYVKGGPGDIVGVREDGGHQMVYLNDQYVGAALRKARNGSPLTPTQEGVLPPGKFFMWTPHPRSFDSRYNEIGWIDESRIIGRAVRLF
ncbi:S26 family signal peptidase [Alcanivorax sp.]|uniref:S26 family signal peptidase n=1 Tax=Alcanivorax sp. TaxID=1872427 RepID=UPI002585FCC4|nr:S26 family signal peptidase [Alcanivorax sp.]